MSEKITPKISYVMKAMLHDAGITRREMLKDCLICAAGLTFLSIVIPSVSHAEGPPAMTCTPCYGDCHADCYTGPYCQCNCECGRKGW